MSDHADGSIVIDTSLDNSGFEKGTEKLLNAIKDLSGKIESMGSAFEKSFSAVSAVLGDLASKTSAVYERTASSATRATDANTQYASSMRDTEQTVTSASHAASAYEAALAKVQKQIDAQKAKLAEYYQQQEQIRQSTDEMLKHAETEEQVTHVLEMEEIEMQKLNEKYSAQIKTLADLEAEYARLAEEKAKAANTPDPEPAPAPMSDTLKQWQTFGNTMKSIKSAVSGVITHLKNLVKIPFNTVVRGAKSLASGLKNISTNSKSASLQANEVYPMSRTILKFRGHRNPQIC